MDATLDTNIKNIEDAKASVRKAIEAKGVAIQPDALIDTYADRVNEIKVSGELNLTGTGWEKLNYFPFSPYRYDRLDSDLDKTRVAFKNYKPGDTFQDDHNIVYGPVVDTSTVTNFDNFFMGANQLEIAPPLDTSSAISMKNMFYVSLETSYSKLYYVPIYDTSKVADMSNMFRDCSFLSSCPVFDTSNVKYMKNTFYGCNALSCIPFFNTKNVIDVTGMLSYTTVLTIPSFNTGKCEIFSRFLSTNSLIREIPKLDTSNGSDFSEMFFNCKSLEKIPELDLGKATNIRWMTAGCTALKTLGGFLNLKVSLELSGSPKLTKTSIMNVINKLGQADPAYSGGKPELTLNKSVYALLNPQDIAIATKKGWTITQR